jgi:hypothetical protein
MRNRFVLSILLAAVFLLLIAPATAWATPGDLEWLQTWSPPAGTESGGHSVVRGPGGDLWVGGNIFKTWTSNDIVVTRWSGDGQRRWVKVIDLAAQEYYGDIAVDRAGNAYVAGAIITYKDSEEIDQWRVMKLSPRGRVLWVKKRPLRVASPGERAWDVAVDSAGNAYCAGQLWSAGMSTFAIVKYTPGGRVAWTRTLALSNEEHGAAMAIALDGAGHVYAAGELVLRGGNAGFAATVRYGPTGHLDWRKLNRSFADASDELRCIAVSKAGVVAAGSSAGPTYADGLVLLYGLDGKRKLESVLPGWLGRTGVRWETVAITAAGRIAVGGQSTASGGKSYFSMGMFGGPPYGQIKVYDYDPLAGGVTGACHAVAFASDGRIFGTGAYSDGTSHVMHTESWDQILPNWSVNHGANGDGRSVVLVPDGVVVTGSDAGKLVVVKYER